MIKKFKDFFNKKNKKDAEVEKDRSGHLAWDAGDVDHHDIDRSTHLAWNVDDVEHHDVQNEDIDEAFYKTIGGDEQYYPAHFSGMSNFGPTPKKWEKGKISHLAKDIEDRRQRPRSNISNHPDQMALPLDGGKGSHSYSGFKDRIYQHDEGEVHEMFKKHHDNLNSSHLMHIENYKSESSVFNRRMRETKGKEGLAHLEDQHHALDHVTSHKIQQPLTLYRGAGNNWFPSHLKEGHTFTDHGFTGTSLRARTAASFKDEGIPGKLPHVFRIHAPAGTKAHFIDMHYDAPHTHEREILLHRGTKFKVMGSGVAMGTDHRGDNQKYKITDLHVVSQRKRKLKFTPEV